MIREINELDYELLKNIYQDIFNVLPNFNEAFSIKKVFVKDNNIIGLIDYSIIYERAELNYIYVIDDYKKKGIATKLMNNMFNDLINKNIDSITLEVSIKNEKAINLYNKFGFKIISTRPNYYKNEDAYLMQKEVL